ncbi:MAG: hypothetical protein KUG77_10550 [Nannocystaceae bacterium]|nr:hypothetical protein [Nannocystaceae bacterium]
MPGRARWCPGAAVEPWTLDITDAVNIGEPTPSSTGACLLAFRSKAVADGFGSRAT